MRARTHEKLIVTGRSADVVSVVGNSEKLEPEQGGRNLKKKREIWEIARILFVLHAGANVSLFSSQLYTNPLPAYIHQYKYTRPAVVVVVVVFGAVVVASAFMCRIGVSGSPLYASTHMHAYMPRNRL